VTKRLIEEWLPIAEIGEECKRERASAIVLPPIYYLHVWWARRPLVASRAAVLASLLPADADREVFQHVLGIHGDPVAAKKRIDKAKRTGENLGLNPYGYRRAFTYLPSSDEQRWVAAECRRAGITALPITLDPTAGGGSIPLESLRLGFFTLANDLNPVAVLVQKATLEWPAKYGRALIDEFKRLTQRFLELAEPRFQGIYPREEPDNQIIGYLWARTINCPYCAGMVPLSPNWKLAPDGTGVRILPQLGQGLGDGSRHCRFEIVASAREHSEGTVKGGDATCPYPDCSRVIDGDNVKQQAQADGMGEQLFAVAFKRRLATTYTKTGKPRTDKWALVYRAPRPEDDNSAQIAAALAERMPVWEALDLVPNEQILSGHKTDEPIRYGMIAWRDLFSPRQLLCHGTSSEIYRELLTEESTRPEGFSDFQQAALGYIALALDKLRDYNSRMTRWHSGREVIVNTFDRHDFAFKWSYAEMAPLMVGLGYEWVFGQVAKCIGELNDLVEPGGTNPTHSGPLFAAAANATMAAPVTLNISCGSGDSLTHIASSSVDIVVMDPPYYNNVMYAELSDFFYVWLKRTAGLLYPELFMAPLTNKEDEAVANPALHKGNKGVNALALAGVDYQHKMAKIFSECCRVLKDDGVLTLMFTHKATGAWDALTMGLIDAGFVINASWPIHTEPESSLHIKDKAAAKSTIFLVCRQRPLKDPAEAVQYWEDLEPRLAAAVRQRIASFQAGGIRGVDLYLSCYGPALEEFSRHWPIKRGQPKPIEEQAKRRGRSQPLDFEMTPEEKAELPYRVTPEDALDAARREVKAWRMEKLTSGSRRAQLDPLTEWFVLAWDAFEAPQFPYDEALRLARVVGLDLDKDVVGVLAEKKASDLILWDSSTRATKGKLGAPDGTKSWIDAIHHCAHRARNIDLNAAKQLLDDNGLANSPVFLTALEAVLEVLPLSARYTGFDPVKAAAPAASDFEALENLRRLALAEQVPAPKQLELVLAELAEAP
jgi:adenine-specific DNA methylase